MNLIKGITFDLEGTIVNLEKYHYKAHLLSAKKYGINLSLSEALKKIPSFVGGPDLVVANALSKLSERNIDPNDILESKEKYFGEIFYSKNKIRPRKGFYKTFEWFKEQKFGFAIGTVTKKEFAIELLQKINLLNEFNINNLVALEDVRETKPAPEVYVKTASNLSISPAEQLVFEDSVIGAKAAIGAGSKVIVIPILKNDFLSESFRELGVNQILYDWDLSKIKRMINKY